MTGVQTCALPICVGPAGQAQRLPVAPKLARRVVRVEERLGLVGVAGATTEVGVLRLARPRDAAVGGDDLRREEERTSMHRMSGIGTPMILSILSVSESMFVLSASALSRRDSPSADREVAATMGRRGRPRAGVSQADQAIEGILGGQSRR